MKVEGGSGVEDQAQRSKLEGSKSCRKWEGRDRIVKEIVWRNSQRGKRNY